MPIRRIFLRWMFIAVVVLPLWPLLGWAIFDGGGGGWDFLGLMVAMPVLFFVLLIVALLFYGRANVRRNRALEWADVGVLAVWHAAIIGFGFFGPTMALFAGLGVIAGLGALWYGLWRIVREAAVRNRETLAEFDRLANASRGNPPPRFDDDGDVIIIEERRPS